MVEAYTTVPALLGKRLSLQRQFFNAHGVRGEPYTNVFDFTLCSPIELQEGSQNCSQDI